MARKHLQHIKSSQLNKAPNASDLLFGEIAVNYAAGGETLFIKNSDGEVVSFPNINIILDNELAIAGGMADLDNRLTTLTENVTERFGEIAEQLGKIETALQNI